MDIYHKVLRMIFESTGGREQADVDLADMLKTAGYLPSLDEICNHLKAEGWVAESRPYILQITHWGVAEARRSGPAGQDVAIAVEKESKRLLAETREFAALVEEFIAEASPEKNEKIRRKFKEIEDLVGKLKSA
jgi:hypothetical protein